MTGGFGVLVVCTGNLCRSPLAEALLLQGFDTTPNRLQISSAGVRGVVGCPVPAEIEEVAGTLGASLKGFRARQLTVAMIADADLILTMERSHRTWVVQKDPRAVRRTFTLREFSRIAPLVAPESDMSNAHTWRSSVDKAGRFRSAPHVAPYSDDVIDPFGRWDQLDVMLRQMLPAIDRLLAWGRNEGGE